MPSTSDNNASPSATIRAQQATEVSGSFMVRGEHIEHLIQIVAEQSERHDGIVRLEAQTADGTIVFAESTDTLVRETSLLRHHPVRVTVHVAPAPDAHPRGAECVVELSRAAIAEDEPFWETGTAKIQVSAPSRAMGNALITQLRDYVRSEVFMRRRLLYDPHNSEVLSSVLFVMQLIAVALAVSLLIVPERRVPDVALAESAPKSESPGAADAISSESHGPVAREADAMEDVVSTRAGIVLRFNEDAVRTFLSAMSLADSDTERAEAMAGLLREAATTEDDPSQLGGEGNSPNLVLSTDRSGVHMKTPGGFWSDVGAWAIIVIACCAGLSFCVSVIAGLGNLKTVRKTITLRPAVWLFPRNLFLWGAVKEQYDRRLQLRQ